MMNTALVIPVRLFGRWEGFLHSWGCFRFFLLVLFLCAPLAVHAQWEPDRRMTFDDSASGTSLNNKRCIVAGPASYVHLVWSDRRVGTWHIYYLRSTDWGANWSRDTCLTPQTSAAISPGLFVSDSLVYLVWVDYRDGNEELYFKRSSDFGVSWSQDLRLTHDPAMTRGQAISASDSLVHVVWYDYRDGIYPELYYKRSTDFGASWSSDVRLTNDSLGSWNPSICTSGENVHVLWDDDRVGNDEIYYKRSTDYGLTWTADTRLTYDTCCSYLPCADVSGSEIHVVWSDFRPFNSSTEVYYKHSLDQGLTWTTDRRLTFARGRSDYASIAASGNNVHVVWQDDRDSLTWTDIRYMMSTDRGQSWSQDTLLTCAPLFSWHPSVAAFGSIVHAVWEDYRDRNKGEIYYKRNPTGNSGVEDSSGRFQPPTSNFSFSVFPNPFTSFATLPGYERVSFVLYDVSGRKVGVYRGDRVGSGLSAGVYFLRPQEGKAKPVRVVKVR